MGVSIAGKPTIPEVVGRFSRYSEQPGNGVWGSLHIVVADHNTEDHSVQWCIDHAHEIGDFEGEELAKILLRMSRKQRRKMSGAVWALQHPGEVY